MFSGLFSCLWGIPPCLRHPRSYSIVQYSIVWAVLRAGAICKIHPKKKTTEHICECRYACMLCDGKDTMPSSMDQPAHQRKIACQPLVARLEEHSST